MKHIYCKHCGNEINISTPEKQVVTHIMIDLMIENTHIKNIDYDIQSLFNACIECCDYPDYHTDYRFNED